MIKLIVNADDFGWDENRTKAILEAYRLGITTTTTAMVNMPWFERAIDLAEGTPLYDNIGLHLCLTEGRPLTDKIRHSSLFCDAEGNFTGRFHRSLKTRLRLPHFEQQAVFEEAEAQMSKYLDCGLPLRHLDSHHHAHTDYSIARIVLPLAARMGFKSVRMSRNFGGLLTPAKRLYKVLVNRKLQASLPFRVDCFGAFSDLKACWTTLEPGTSVEVMVHPLYRQACDGELELGGTLMDHRTPIPEIAAFFKSREKDFLITDYAGLRRYSV